MRITVFGAAGWLGRAVLANLAGRHEVRAFDLGPQAWEKQHHIDGTYDGSDIIHGNISDYATVIGAIESADAVIHLAAYFPHGEHDEQANDDKPFMVNLKGLWNVLDASHQLGVKRVVHVGSCQVRHPKGIFFTADIRRPDGGLYAVCKRLQEEMCRQIHEATGLSIIVLRPDGIIDSRLGLDNKGRKLGPKPVGISAGSVCRHDLAQACRLAAESHTIDFDIFHVAGGPGADETCDVARSRQVLGLKYEGDFEQYME